MATTPTEAHVIDELLHICTNGHFYDPNAPIVPGTIPHMYGAAPLSWATVRECIARGWVVMEASGFTSTAEGRFALAKHWDEIMARMTAAREACNDDPARYVHPYAQTGDYEKFYSVGV